MSRVRAPSIAHICTMNHFQAFILGILQGFTEFFPISSSAHLKLLENFFDLPDSLTDFDLICHFGTLLALCVYFRKKLVPFFIDPQNFFLVCLAIFPLIPMYFAFSWIKSYLSGIFILGPFLIVTGIFLLKTSPIKDQIQESPKRKIKDVLCIGVMQSLALIPGLSRSGSTIFMGCKRGWSFNEARVFSFLLAIPTILGGCFLQTLRSSFSLQFSWGIYLVGLISSFLSGLLGVYIFFSWIHEKNFPRFGYYCLMLGLLIILYKGWSYVL